MPDMAISTDPGVQSQLNRLTRIAPPGDDLGLDRMMALMERVGNPQRQLPPVFHVAGTNGKGSTCAFIRAALEEAGHRVHAYTSPHLVRFNERFRIGGRLIDDVELALLLEEVLDVAQDIHPTFFEVTTAVAFLAFARFAADACVIEVGLGGRLDATNVIEKPLVAGIAQLAIDHEAQLGRGLLAIAGEKAGIAKAGAPLVTLDYPGPVTKAVAEAAKRAEAELYVKGRHWDAARLFGRIAYRDAEGFLDLPEPLLPGAWQATNASLAVAMVRHQSRFSVSDAALSRAIERASWPARFQQLAAGPLVDRLPTGSKLWLDGLHNPAAAEAVVDHLGALVRDRPLHLVVGMLTTKDPVGALAAFKPLRPWIHAVPIPGHPSYAPRALCVEALNLGLRACAHESVGDALDRIRLLSANGAPPMVLIGGSLYLAGAVLSENGPLPE